MTIDFVPKTWTIISDMKQEFLADEIPSTRSACKESIRIELAVRSSDSNTKNNKKYLPIY